MTESKSKDHVSQEEEYAVCSVPRLLPAFQYYTRKRGSLVKSYHASDVAGGTDFVQFKWNIKSVPPTTLPVF